MSQAVITHSARSGRFGPRFSGHPNSCLRAAARPPLLRRPKRRRTACAPRSRLLPPPTPIGRPNRGAPPYPQNPGEEEKSPAMPMLAMALRARPLRPVLATLALRLGRPAPARPLKELASPVLPSPLRLSASLFSLPPLLALRLTRDEEGAASPLLFRPPAESSRAPREVRSRARGRETLRRGRHRGGARAKMGCLGGVCGRLPPANAIVLVVR